MKEVRVELTEDDLREILIRGEVYIHEEIDIVISLEDRNLDIGKIIDEVKKHK